MGNWIKANKKNLILHKYNKGFTKEVMGAELVSLPLIQNSPYRQQNLKPPTNCHYSSNYLNTVFPNINSDQSTSFEI